MDLNLSNTTQFPAPDAPDEEPASDISSDDPILKDKLACDQIEQVVVKALNELDTNQVCFQHVAVEESQEVMKKEDIKLEEKDLELLRTRITEGLNGVVMSRTRGILSDDAHILRSAKHFELDPDFRFIRLDEDVAEFYIIPDSFEVWMGEHQRSISTNFVQRRGYEYNDPENQNRLTFECQCAGKKRERNDRIKGGLSGKTRMRKQGIKSGCLSKLAALFQPILMADGSRKPGCIVEYRYQHNHSIGDITDLGTRQKSAAIKATIERLINQGSSIQRVMQKLTMDYDKFTQITRGNGQQLSRDDFITYDDVYNIWHRITTTKMRKDPDPVLSAMKWMGEFERNNGFTFYDENDRTSGTYFGFASLWQLQQLKTHGRTLCFDGTHNVFGHETNLFTLVLKNTDTGFGIPVAFLLTKTRDALILVNWLTALRIKMKGLFSTDSKEYMFTPNAVITDQGSTEILAIKTVFPGVPIFYCAWHVLRLWEREVKSRMTGLGVYPVARRNEIRTQVRSDLRMILYERDIAKAQELVKGFRATWNSQKGLLEYLDKNYFGRAMFEAHERQVVDVQESWMLCYRQDVSYASIDTNNYIESWHNTLKRHFFRDKQQRRADTVIYVLANLAVPHFQQKCIRSIVNVGRMNPAQAKELRLTALAADHVQTRESRGYVGAYIKQMSEDTLYVESFTNAAAGYDITIDFSKTPTGHITRCSCKYFSDHRSCCKHIALVQ
ncbi:hypothetical protein BGX30_005609, partial [Mortierella sp. GBA39]